MESQVANPGEPLTPVDVFTLAGDWHGDTSWARHVIESARPAAAGRRVIIQLGDFGVWPGRGGQRYLDSVARCLRDNNAVCLFLDGNHEDFPQLTSYPIDGDGLRQVRPGLFHLPRGTRWVWHGVRFLALGGATSLDRPWRTPMLDWWSDEELSPRDFDRAIAGGPCDVLLSHDAPAGVEVPNLPPRSTWDPVELHRADNHRSVVREIVDATRPAFIFHGHFHSRYDAQLELADGHTVNVTGLSNEQTGTDNYIELVTADHDGAPAR
jgi:Calcineurin-like phosphoesterase